MIKTEIYFFRHAQTEWNQQRRFQGQKDSALSETGIMQSRKMKERILALNPEIFVTSALNRTKNTLYYALEDSKVNSVFLEMKDFNEAAFGCWEGMLIGDVVQNYESEFRLYREQPHLFAMKGAETYLEIQERAVNGIEKILRKYPGKKTAVITHGMVLLCLTGYLRNIPIKNIRDKVSIPDNTDYIKTSWYC